jgi:hypothetical protein
MKNSSAFSSESSPYLQAAPSGRGDHRVWSSGYRRGRRDALRGFQGAVIFQKIRDACRAE